MALLKHNFTQDIKGYIKYSKITANRCKVSFWGDENIKSNSANDSPFYKHTENYWTVYFKW